MPSILLIEDDARIRRRLVDALAERGHEVRSAREGLVGLEEALSGDVDLVVLDLGLPDIDGIRVLKMIRAVSDVPIVIATARDDESEIVGALNAGADDYVVKPFSAEQLDARIRALLRRLGPTESGPVVVGELSIDTRTREASLAGNDLDLTRREFDLLAYLAEHAGTVVSRRTLLAEIWNEPFGAADKTVDVHLSWLRKKLGETAANPTYLHTVRGVGIKLVGP